MRIDQFFAVPIARVENADYSQLNPDLSRQILKMEAEGDAYREQYRRDTQHGQLFESQWDLFYRQEPCFRQLAAFCHKALATCVYNLSSLGEKEFLSWRWHYDAWFHVTRNGGYQGLHNHPNASWSGIYCVDPGDQAEDDFSGVVRMHDPRSNANYYRDPGNERLKAPVNCGGVDVWHKGGQLVLFPSYLMHEVFPYTGRRPRIVVAFNASVAPPSRRD